MDTRSRSWVAVAGLALAVLGLLMELAGAWGYRQGWFGLRVSLRYLFGYGGLVALAGGVVSLAGLAHARLARRGGAFLALAGLVIGVVAARTMAAQLRLARSVPPINDVSTDLANPPEFVTARTHAFWQGKDMAYPAGFADSVRRGYPDLAPLVLPLPAARAYALARETAQRMPRWEITGTDSAGGRLEATATTRWFGFKDDLVIRVAPLGGGTDSAVVDMRSKSRVGRSDVGANAARIRAYLAALRRSLATR